MKSMKSSRLQAGFTLLELLITVAIIAILSVLAAAAYGSFAAKAEAAEGMSLVSSPKLSWEIAFSESGGIPPITNAAAGIGLATTLGGKYVSRIDIEASGIVTNFGGESDPDLNGTQFVLTPYETLAGTVVWGCQGGPVPVDSTGVPYPIAGTAAGAPLLPTGTTTMPVALSPKFCRP